MHVRQLRARSVLLPPIDWLLCAHAAVAGQEWLRFAAIFAGPLQMPAEEAEIDKSNTIPIRQAAAWEI